MHIVVVGVPFAEGQNLIGVEKSPDALRKAGLIENIKALGHTVEDLGNVNIQYSETHTSTCESSEADSDDASVVLDVVAKIRGLGPRSGVHKLDDNDPNMKALTSDPREIVNQPFLGACLEKAFKLSLEAAQRGFVLNLGGDHSIGCPSVTASAAVHPNLNVIWVDAHADCNTPYTSESMHYHGMPVAHFLDWFKSKSHITRKDLPEGLDFAPYVRGFEWLNTPVIKEKNLVLLGLRDVDSGEKQLLNDSDVNCFTMRSIDKYGIGEVMRRILETIPTGPIHMSFDIDSIDGEIVPGTGTRVRGGLTYREAHYICEEVASTGRLVGMDLVEINPFLDTESSKDVETDDLSSSQTVLLGNELVLSALGKTVLGEK